MIKVSRVLKSFEGSGVGVGVVSIDSELWVETASLLIFPKSANNTNSRPVINNTNSFFKERIFCMAV